MGLRHRDFPASCSRGCCPDGTRNSFRIQRLKDKLGNRANASAEIELDDTYAVLVGEPGRGVATIIEMVARTRLDCVLGSAAGMRQAVAEAVGTPGTAPPSGRGWSTSRP